VRASGRGYATKPVRASASVSIRGGAAHLPHPPWREGSPASVVAVDDWEPAGSLTTNFNVSWTDGSSSREATEDCPEVGDIVVQARHPGALGFAWGADEPRFEPSRCD